MFWLSVGAAAGITSYRRATAVGRAISVRVAGDRPHQPVPPAAAPGPFWPPRPPGMPGTAAPAPLAPSGAAALPAARPAAQWSMARAAWRTSRALWRAQKAAAGQARAAGRFARDVRAGMDLYMNRQDGRSGPTLTSAERSAQTPRTDGTQRPPVRPR